MKQSIIIEWISCLLILLFLYTGVSKLIDFKGFVQDMHNQPFPSWLKMSIVWALPAVEIIVPISLIFDRSRRAGLYASLVVMVVFTIYTAAVLLDFFGYTPCSCGGVIRTLSWKQHLLFNLFFTGLSLWGIVLYAKKKHNK